MVDRGAPGRGRRQWMVDGGWFGWKVLRGFQPDGAVLELYTGLALKTRRQPAFAPETNLTLASSTLPASSVQSNRERSTPVPISRLVRPCVSPLCRVATLNRRYADICDESTSRKS